MSNVNYICDSTSSSISDMAAVAGAISANTATATSSNVASTTNHPNSTTGQIITYELERNSINTGFGFDLKGDRPCIISAVHPGTIAYESGLTEGDLVIAINNRKCTDLDHQQVVLLISRCKHKLVLKVAKARKMSKMAAVNRAQKAYSGNDMKYRSKRSGGKNKRITSKGLNWVNEFNKFDFIK